MKKKQIFTVILTIITSLVYSQNKKDLNATISKLRLDSTALELTIKDNNLLINSLKKEIFDYKELNTVLHDKNKILSQELQKMETLIKDTKTENALLNDSIENLQKSVDSINTFSHITRFVQAFYKSLELSEAENQRQYEIGDVRFDLDNFSRLIGKDAKYSKERVENLSDENYHDRYYIELLSIENIKFENNKITVSTNVLYTGYEMGSFYNEEQLTLQDNKGLLSLTSWLDVDLYKMELSEYEHMENFTKDDFYKWLGSYNKN